MVMSKAVLEVRGLECGYDRPVIKDVNINVGNGELVVLMGPNGAGKSTLIKCILGMARVFGGSIRVNGEDALRMGRREIARLVSYVPQNHAVAYPVRVFDTVLLGRLPHMGFRPSKLDIDTALNAMRRLGIEYLANKLVTRLSGGEAQLVHIARAIAQGGVLMLLDEPTSNLDLKHQVAVMETLIRIAREDGIAVLATMHDINLALKYADRIYVMREGRIVAELSPGDISPSIIEEVYGVKTTVIEHNGRPVVIV
ncbi:ABC transporter ATP-binding protein [Vulcanisaeta sp. JCM 16159]|uniref:ABC transporter ATP-binding protein n=1 Tax=Vulcanisaeta sp. JCM 16159 TaxID=1295371 RepID=UPI001FB20224|nr:ABC transporter ATP-binding protein [Vulcanisaeta sp. JCM 16159]